MQLSSIHVYPIKGARGIAVLRADVLFGGLRHDRRFMIVDGNGRFITQREVPELALVTTEIVDDALVIGTPTKHPKHGDFGGSARVPLVPDGHHYRRVRVWHDAVEALEVPGDASALLSEHLARACTLVFMPDHVVRAVDPRFARADDRVGFADGFPILLASEASLADLNVRLSAPIPMDRFRPNLVVSGGAPFEEDHHDRATIGSLSFRMPKRCSRCQVITIDQATAKSNAEPLRVLATYRALSNNVYFAQNLIPDTEGALTVGVVVEYPVDRG